MTKDEVIKKLRKKVAALLAENRQMAAFIEKIKRQVK